MNNVKLLIDNTECDYKEIKDFDFNVTAKLRDFKKVVSVEGFELDNSAKLLPLPATKRNKRLLLNQKNTVLSFKLFVDNRQRFSGKCIYKSENYKNDTLKTLNVEVFGGNSDFIQQINDLTLRDLDLGTDSYTQASILSSLSGDATTHKGIFSPVVYGSLKSEIENQWSVADLRYHVYFDTILKGIADTLNINLQSDFTNRNIWLKGCYAFGVGKDWISTTQNNQTTTAPLPTTAITFTATVKGVYSVSVYVPATGGAVDLDHVLVTTSAGYVSDDFLYVSGQTTVFNLQNITLDAGDTISLEGHNTGHGAREMPAGTVFSLFGGFQVIEGKDFLVSSCLHNEPIKNLFKMWVSMFNWTVFYNPITRLLRVEPTFDYKIGNQTYKGFYKLPKDGYNQLDEDVTNMSKNYSPIFDKIRFSYKENSILDSQVLGFNTSTIDTLGTETSISDSTKIQNYGDTYFERCYNGIMAGVVTGSRTIPILLDKDINIKEETNTPEKPTFLSNPTCFFVSNTNISIVLEGSTITNVPILMQNNHGSIDDFSYSFCDLDVLVGGVTVTKRGLVSIFYQQLFSIFKRYEQLNAKIRVKDVLSIQSFNKMYKRNNEFYILSSLSNIKTNNVLFDAELIKFSAIRTGDENDTIHNKLEQAQLTLSIK